MNRFQKLMRAAAATVIIFMLGCAWMVNANATEKDLEELIEREIDNEISEKFQSNYMADSKLALCKYAGGKIVNKKCKTIIKINDKEYYFGETVNGKFDGAGVYQVYYKASTRGIFGVEGGVKWQYSGNWKNGKKHGYGTLKEIFSTKQGYWENDKFMGNAKLNQPDSNVGQIVNSEKNVNIKNKNQVKNNGFDDIEREQKLLAEELRKLEEKKRAKQQESSARSINLKVANTTPSNDGTFTIEIQTNTDTASLKINGEELGGRIDGKYLIKKVARAGGDTQFTIIATDVNGNTETETITVSRPLVESKSLVATLNPAQVKKQPERDAVAIIIGIADYKNLPRADYANDDARVFYDYAIRALGVKPENIRLLVDTDADQAEIYRAFKTWLPSRVRATTDVYVYYSGHGLPTADGQGLYVLPQRADRDFIDKTAITQAEINTAIQAAKPKSVTIFLDACYSGQARTGETLLASARPVALKMEKQLFPDSFTVISASQADQISSSSPDLKHGIFSYYLMRGMEGDADTNKDGRITAGEMHKYLTEQVARQAGMMNRQQVPQLIGDANRVLVGR